MRNPSALFLGEGGERAAGAAVFAGIEGSRPVLVEFQALVAPSAYGTPRRAVVGWDSGRLAMVLAVLEARCGLGFGARDVYLNVAGGLAHDRAGGGSRRGGGAGLLGPGSGSAAGLRGVRRNQSFGRRPAGGRTEMRLKEAVKLGFSRALGPPGAAETVGMRQVTGGAAGRRRLSYRRRGVGRSMSLFDLAAGLVLVVSAIVGWVRGASREVATVAAIVIAAVVAIAALRFTGGGRAGTPSTRRGWPISPPS